MTATAAKLAEFGYTGSGEFVQGEHRIVGASTIAGIPIRIIEVPGTVRAVLPRSEQVTIAGIQCTIENTTYYFKPAKHY